MNIQNQENNINLEGPVFHWNLETRSYKFPELIEVTNFLYDFNMLYEINRLALDKKYEDFKFSHFTYFRKGRPLNSEDRLRVSKLKEESPLCLESIIMILLGTPPAIYSTICLIEKFTGKNLFKQREIKSPSQIIPHEETEFFLHNRKDYLIHSEEVLRARRAHDYVMHASDRIMKSSIRIEEITLDIKNIDM